MGSEVFAILGIFLGIPTILLAVYRTHLQHVRFMKTLQLKAEANARMLDRFGSDAAFLDYLKSDAQQKLFDVQVPEPHMPAPYMRMLTAIQISFLLLSAGGACLYIRSYMFRGDQEFFLFLGTMGVALGIGAFLSAIAALVVARLWRQIMHAESGANV